MKSCWFIVAVVGLPLSASTLDISANSEIVLHTGDELLYTVSIQNYQMNAKVYHVPLFPLTFDFTFVTEPTDSPVTFAAGLESPLGSETFSGRLTFQPGIFDSGTYSGPISTLSSSLSLTSAESRLIFGTGAAVLYIEDLGGDVTIGLPPYTLRQDLYASAGGGGLSVGAIAGSVKLAPGVAAPVPEPDAGLLMLGGGTALCLTAAFLRRLQPRHDGDIQ